VIRKKNEADVRNKCFTSNGVKEGIKFLNNVENCVLFEFRHLEDLVHLCVVNPRTSTVAKTKRNDVPLFPFESLKLAASTEIMNDPNMEDDNWMMAPLC